MAALIAAATHTTVTIELEKRLPTMISLPCSVRVQRNSPSL
jgi:hypothetical protein